MGKWSGRSARYPVKIYYTRKGRAQITLPAPIIRELDRPDQVVFTLGPDSILIEFVHSHENESSNAT
jgi:hypothetical protein